MQTSGQSFTAGELSRLNEVFSLQAPLPFFPSPGHTRLTSLTDFLFHPTPLKSLTRIARAHEVGGHAAKVQNQIQTSSM